MIYKIISFFVLLLFCSVAHAEELSGLINYILSNNHTIWSFNIQILYFLMILAFLPVFILMTTSFTRIIIVLGLLRNALGMAYSPPNQILLGMALFLTFFVMNPTFNEIYKNSYLPFSENKIQIDQAIIKGLIPIRKFMVHQIRESDLNLFSELANIKNLSNIKNIPMKILIPSFITSELKTAFQIGCMILMPFLIIDLVVSSILMSLGMIMVPPSTISLPFKLILFVLVDGWRLIFSSLVHSFY